MVRTGNCFWQKEACSLDTATSSFCVIDQADQKDASKEPISTMTDMIMMEEQDAIAPTDMQRIADTTSIINSNESSRLF